MYYECHGHIFMDGINFKAARELHLHGVNREDVHKKLAIMQEEGITYFRDGGDCLGVSQYARTVAEEYGIEYRTPLFAIHKNGHYGGIVGLGFENWKEYHALVLRAKQERADFIKVMFSGILDFAGDGGVNEEPLTSDEIREMIHIAHEEGFRVMAHVNGAAPVLAALEAGVDSIEHGNFQNEESLQCLRDCGTVYVPTVVTVRNLLSDDRFDHGVIRAIWEGIERNIRYAAEIGVCMALGSDAGAYRVLHGQGIMDEYRAFRDILKDVPEREMDGRLREGEERIRGFVRRI